MDHVLRHVSVEPGDSVVARFGNAAGVFRTSTDAEADRAEELIEILEAAGQASTFPGEDLARSLAPMILESGKAGLPPFALVASIQKGFVVLLHGSAWAHLTTEDTTLHLAGDSALTWVDRIVTGNYTEIALTLSPGAQRPTNPRSDLRLGSVSGNGLVLRARASALPPKRAAPAPEPAPAPAPAPKPAPLPEPAPAPKRAAAPAPAPAPKRAPTRAPQTAPVEETQAAPVARKKSKDEPTTAPTPTMPELEETMASMAAFTLDDETQASPAAMMLDDDDDTLGGGASTAGQARVDSAATQLSPAFTSSPTPVLVGADGSKIFLDRNYVLGRDPRTDPAVRRGEASPITIPDDSDAVSRVHAYIDAAKGKITIRDNGATNGTFVAAPGAQQWVKITTDPMQLFTGWAVCLGNRVYVLQSAEDAKG